MNDDLKALVKDSADRIEVPPEDLGEVERRGKRQRWLTRMSAVLIVAVLSAAGWMAWASVDDRGLPPVGEDSPPRDAIMVLPDHVIRLRAMLPEEVGHLATTDLVLLYRKGSEYHAFYEGIFPNSCPIATSGRTCFSTAVKTVVAPGDGKERRRGSDLIQLSVPDDAEVVWRGEPATGPIGVEAYNACDRAERFEPEFRCVDGSMEYVADADGKDQRTAKQLRRNLARLRLAVEELRLRHQMNRAFLSEARRSGRSGAEVGAVQDELEALQERIARFRRQMEMVRGRIDPRDADGS
jgi:HAMP domain-containing protein